MPAAQKSGSSRAVAPRGGLGVSPFPSSHHLVVTTRGHVHAVQQTGSRELFRSCSRGILAAREAKDGSGTLAISDSHNVILHRIEDGQQRSYRLKGSESHISLLEFSQDSKTLFFATTILNAVQAYSLAEGRLLEPGPLHNSRPTALAVSPTSDILLSASEDPPVVYLQNRTLGTQPLLLQPLASQAPIVQACFHPNRPNVFLLAYKDGAVAAYDATRLLRSYGDNTAFPQSHGAEIHVFQGLHAVSSRSVADPDDSPRPREHDCTGFGLEIIRSSSRGLNITGAAFLPGSRGQAVTCGIDGKCKVIDFEKKYTIRSWHVRAPATALSVLPPGAEKVPLVAVGKIDGKVAVYHLSGTLLKQFEIGESSLDPIIAVEWIRGSGPRLVEDRSDPKAVDETWIELYEVQGSLRSRKTKRRCDSTARNGLADCALVEDLSTGETNAVEAGGTVCYRLMDAAKAQNDNRPTGTNYMDLFSPIKPCQAPPDVPAMNPPHRTTPRQRPRISSSTFRNVDERTEDPNRKEHFSINEPLEKPRQPACLSRPSPTTTVTPSPDAGETTIARLLAAKNPDGMHRSRQDAPGKFTLFAPYMPQMKSTVKKKTSARRRSSQVSNLSLSSFSPKKPSTAEARTPCESLDEDDIWLTAESDYESDVADQPRGNQMQRGRRSRRLKWPSERSGATSAKHTMEKPQRPSIKLPMSSPIGSRSNTRPRQKVALASNFTHNQMEPSMHPSVESSMASSLVSPQTESGHEATQMDNALRPGFAQSYQGPVKVDSYLPRRSSLAFPSSPHGAKVRSTLGDVSGHEQRRSEAVLQTKRHDELTCRCCTKMRDEVAALRAELAQLRRMLNGKDREK
ncbi:uncharacterized protein PV09_01968 [Verruconis gallopava]|uniref:WD40 repeat-like protein n=1 Tax=Verruconis gallopava TaxID=253628 RepID=A0A0D2B774_9PEZI|nr:uncharacterized protein PV09_01968 [Verruconis gallopava]KIW07084.1 hypothetical protein PV09_01968 [Verruconis gallopava]